MKKRVVPRDGENRKNSPGTHQKSGSKVDSMSFAQALDWMFQTAFGVTNQLRSTMKQRRKLTQKANRQATAKSNLEIVVVDCDIKFPRQVMTLAVLRLHDLEEAHKSCIDARERAWVDVRHKHWSEVP